MLLNSVKDFVVLSYIPNRHDFGHFEKFFPIHPRRIRTQAAFQIGAHHEELHVFR